jgi:hypothetical protein
MNSESEDELAAMIADDADGWEDLVLAAEMGLASCTRCHQPGVPYTYHGERFDGLCDYEGERLCKQCTTAKLNESRAEQRPDHDEPPHLTYRRRIGGHQQ